MSPISWTPYLIWIQKLLSDQILVLNSTFISSVSAFVLGLTYQADSIGQIWATHDLYPEFQMWIQFQILLYFAEHEP